MAWHVFEKLLEGVANYSTFLGKLWVTFFFIFRIIMVASVGDTVYNDEQSQFICNTLQPGCTNVCFNRFSPISQIRFWAVQILFVGMPSVIFIVYAMHKMSSLSLEEEEKKVSRRDRRIEKRRSVDYNHSKVRRRRHEEVKNTSEKSTEAKVPSNHSSLPQYDDLPHGKEKRPINGFVKVKDFKKSSSHHSNENIVLERRLPVEVIEIEPEKKKVQMKTVYNKDGKSEVVKTPAIKRAYFAQTVFTILIEGFFLILQYHMYRFEVLELYECIGDPCPKQVDCYVSRPKEKTLFLLFMYVMTSLSILINVLEIFHSIKKYLCGSQLVSGESEWRLPRSHLPRHGNYQKRRRRGYRPRLPAYPTLGPFPRKHGNSMTDSDGNVSIESDYSFYS